MTRRTCLWLCLTLLLVAVLMLPAVHWRLIGWVKGEAFYQGMPTSYWRSELEQWDPSRPWSARKPSWLEKNLPKPLSSLLGKPVRPLQNGDPEATAVLIELIADEDPKIRLSAFHGLQRIGPPAKIAGSALTQMLHDPDRRLGAATVMSEIGVVNDELIQTLVAGLSSKQNPRFRCAVATVIAKLGAKATPAIPQLIRTLTVEDTTLISGDDTDRLLGSEVRKQLVDALGQMQGEASTVIPVLLAVAENPQANQGVDDDTLRCMALQALCNFGEAARPALPALRKLQKEGSNGSIHFDLDKAILIIEGHEPDASLHAIEKLAKKGRVAIPELEKFRDDENRHVRAAAERAIKAVTESKR